MSNQYALGQFSSGQMTQHMDMLLSLVTPLKAHEMLQHNSIASAPSVCAIPNTCWVMMQVSSVVKGHGRSDAI